MSDTAPVPNDRHAFSGNVPVKFVKTPLLPAGITAPEKEKPSTVSLLPTETVNPASAAKPPDAPVKLAPITSN